MSAQPLPWTPATTVIGSGSIPLDALLYTLGIWDGSFYVTVGVSCPTVAKPVEEKPA